MFLTCFFFSLVSCQKSAKGNWSNSDLKSCKLDFRAELENDSESKEILSLIGSTLDEFSGCACKRLEEKFDSYSFANKKTIAITDEQSAMLISGCFGNLEHLINLRMNVEEVIDNQNELYNKGGIIKNQK